MKEKCDALVEAIKALGCAELEIKIECKRMVGDKMGVIANANKICINGEFTEGLTNIEHKEGEVILLNLWSTKVGPCSAPMAAN